MSYTKTQKPNNVGVGLISFTLSLSPYGPDYYNQSLVKPENSRERLLAEECGTGVSRLSDEVSVAA